MERSADFAQANRPSERAATADPGAIGRKKEALLGALHSFERWLESNGAASYDPYDVWGTPYGVRARRLYYRKHPLGFPMIAPLLLLDILFPAWRKAVVEPERFATADAQLLLGFLNLYHISGESRHLGKARQIAKDLLEHSIPGYSGLCWGYPFDWQNQTGLWKKNTPYITCTPYCYEAYCELAEVTGEEEPLLWAQSIATFIFDDLRDNPTGPEAAAASYSPCDDTQVINASAYRAWVLFDAVARFDRPDYLPKAECNLNFILQNQQADGSWWYGTSPKGRFIDHFHTCFVLKNLFKLNRPLGRPQVSEAIRRGYEFYRRELFYPDATPKPFAVQPRTGIVRAELYNHAEAITLGVLLREEIPEAFHLAKRLAALVMDDFQLPDGHFVTRVYTGGIRHTFPFLRWPQSQLFLALTNLLVTISAPSSSSPPPEVKPKVRHQ